jgi:hypothetical protein
MYIKWHAYLIRGELADIFTGFIKHKEEIMEATRK